MKTHLLTYLMAGVTRSFSPKERSSQNNASGGKSPKLNFLIFILALILLVLGQKGYSQTNTWDGSSSANWNTGGNWSLNHVPLLAEDVVIPNGITTTITVNTAAVCKSFTMSAGSANCSVSIAGGQSLSVTNAVTLNAPSGGGTRTISVAVGTGTFSCASIYMTNSASDTRDAEVNLTTGTVNVTGDITMDGTNARNAIRFTGAGLLNLGGNFLGTNGGSLAGGSGTVNCNGATAQTIPGGSSFVFWNLTINKTGPANTVTNTTNAFTIGNDLTVTQGNLILQATDANSVVTNNINIAANGTLTHSVDWSTGMLLSVGGSFVVSGGGLFTYSVSRSHVQMISAGTENVSTGTNASSAFSILTLMNGTFNANGTLRVNDNFWAMFNAAGNFHTNNQTVHANAALLCSGGTFYIDGGTLNVTGGMQVGNGTAGTVNFSAGTLNADAVTLGSGAITGAFNHSGGTSNISGNLTISNTGTYTCTGSPAINISGDWVNNKTAAGFVPATSTVTFNSVSAAQNINGSAVAQTFGNIVVNKTGQQLNVAGSAATLTLNGSLTITAGTFAAGTASAINVAGNWANNGTAFTAGSGTVTFNGGSAQTISGSTITTFNNITVNNNNGLTTSGIDMIVSGGTGALTFSNGKITTGSNKVTLGAFATVSGAGAGKYIYGNLQMGVATGTPTRVFEIGDASVYAPLSVVFNSVTVAGNVTAYTIGTEHPNILSSTIDETKTVNRYWGMSNSGTSLSNYTATFNWVAADVDAGATTANFIIGRRTSSWAYPSMGTRNPTNCTTTLSSFGTYACGEGGALAPAMAAQPIDQSACSGTSLSYTAAVNNKPNSTVVWEISIDNGATFSTLTLSSPYAVSTSSASNVTTSTLTINPVTTGLDQYSYRAVFTNSRGSVTSFDGLLTVSAAPTANAGSALSPICGGGASAPLGGSVGGSATGGTWSTPSGGTFTPNATTLNATWTPPGAFTGIATLTLTTSGGSCGTATASKTQVVAGAAGAISMTPSSANICRNAIQSLVASNTETSTFSSGTVNVAIPDFNNAGATNTIAVAGIPTGATVTGISVTLNVTHTKDIDLVMNLRAPNGNILNLVNARGGFGANFTNTIINSTSAALLSGGSAPFTGTFAPDATNSVGATGQVSNVIAFSSLYSIANGNWVFSAKDGIVLNSGTINSWSIAITYVDPITWSPVTYLYTNAAATTAYTAGQTSATVYAKPTVAGTTTYTATATNSGGCTTTQTVAVTAGPVVTVTPDYCYPGGFIQLSASSTPAATSWLWSTGATTSTILVNLAGNYTVTATTAGGCTASITSPIAQELVVNGDFSSGNTGFTSTYGFVNYTSGCMYPEGIYTVGTTPNFTHSYFFGKDHTTNSGNLLIVNGSGSPVSVWQETIAVQPNTTYYFSAWAMSLNDAAPFAQLQFDINGSGIGTTAVLPAGPNSTSAPYAWVQFYGSWTSGAGVTSAVVSIKDLQTALGGNDFGLDDISFGTLTSFVSLTSAAGTDNQAVCNNSAISNIIYTIGSGAGGPSVTGLPPGVSWSFTGTTLTISGTPTSTGTYTYTVTTSPCNPVTKTGVITVQDETLSLSSAAGTNAQTPCLNTAITNITYSVGGQATGATVTGLPTGVTGTYSAGVFTISGTPTVAGTTTYTVTTTGSCGTHATLNGTINVRRQIITRTSATGTNAQAVCVNSAITNITYAVGGTATGAGVTGLPAGVTGTYSSGVFTISGTPSVAGLFSYTITTTGTCNAVTAGGTITVNGASATLTSAVGTDAQTICAGTAITDITYNIGGTATGAGISGLPAGVSGSYSLGIFTISGTPTAAGTFNYTITTSGGSCGTTTATGVITVNSTNTITLSSAAGTDAQTKCINTAITIITYATTAATGASFSGLPTGVSGAWASNVVTISGTPTVAGTSTYTVTLTGGCGAAITATGTIAVTANNTISLTSAVGTNAQTKCINTAITNITYATAGATGATFSGLPSGVSGAWAANVVTISGTPSVAGTATYTVTLTGGCGNITATGTITVTANNTITLTSAVGTDAQTKCINTAITNITYSTTGATGATFSGLPTGISGGWAANVVTISGTPTVAGTSTYTVTLTGGCGSITTTGTITVNVNTITLSSAAGTDAQTKCINTAITNITYATTAATGATFSGLPTGVSGAWASNVVTISGTPTVAGTSTYTVTLTGGCGAAITATGTITVTANNTISLTSALGTNAQTKCINTAITNITYSTTGATGATFSGLPTGISGGWAANVVTISGTPSVAGTATYTVILTGGCGNITATGTITVTANNTITLSSAVGTDAQTKCINTAITNITYSTTGATGATFSGLPTGISGGWAANVVTISGTPTVAGTSTYTVTLTGGCGTITTTGTITVTANNTISLTSAVGTNAQTKCINTAITNITYSTTGATGATFSGLPTGVSGGWAANVVTISGTPTVAGTSTYTVTLTGGCGSITTTGTITVTANNTISLTSALGTDAQTKCINTAITNITYSTTGATGATFSGLPTGVSGGWAANVVTISGTPTVAGTSTYTVTLTGGCGSITTTGTITVTANNTISLTSALGTDAQTKCINTAITNITYSTTGATGATFSGLPTGVSGGWAANVVTISGTPSVAGTATYTVTLTGGCGNITATGTITVTANNTITLSSAAGTDAQTKCINTAITNITYSTTGATGATFSGLPTGISGGWAANVVTISGTPTVAGTSTYTVTLTGGCGTITTTGTITVTANNTISLTSAVGTNAQTKCINTAITNITYSTTGATGATFSGLPTGISGGWAANVVTISGTPTVAGTSTYTVTLTGGCGTITTTGTITVTANNTISLTSAVGTNAQTKCINTAITNITYSTTGATGATFSGLPTGVSGGWAANVVTISGTPTVAGTSTYTVTLTGGCGSITATGTITVTANNTISLTSALGTDAQTKCINTAITNITYSTTGATGATFSGLPTGVSGGWAANVVTISGTPTVAGTSTYTVTLTGGCGSITATGTITVTANNTITLSSAAGTDAQTKCINTAITNITYSTTGATGATFSGLPTGISGGWAANVVTISGTPTVAGTSTYTVTLTGGCGTITTTGTITVTANNTISLTSAVGTNAQTKCINTAITNITYSTTGATGATFSGLPAGVSGGWAANVVTISGTPTVAGTSTYTVTLTGGCGNITATGTITVTANNTVTLSSAAGTDAQTKCINTAITNITYSTTGATGATFSGLPTGVSGGWAANVVTISGTPTVAGTSTYTVTLTGGCGSITATGTITVTANNTVTLTSAVGTNAQTKCINTAITNITYSTTGATGATFSGLPTGVSGGWAANVVTISGTPSVAGTATYTVTLTGGCGSITATGTITVTANNTATLTSAVGTNAQTKCINTAITNITYSTTGATGATFSGLPTGVSGAWAANVVTISGTPTVAGTSTYTVTLTGGCGSITATGTITITANNTVTLSSAVGTDAQTKCINTAITNITYSTTGATGATFSGLPTGVSGAWAANVVTISGTPTVAGTSTYTVTLTGGCGSITATGTITVTANNTITLSSAAGTDAQTKCINTAITNITYSTTGATGATFSGLPTGVSGAWAANVVTISGTPTVAGTSTYTVTLTGGCGSITATGTITVTANNTITLSSAAGTDAQTKCINTAITNITYSTTGATGATFSGLPTGVSGAWAANVVTISGTPTVAGASTYTVTLTGGCGSITATGTITVTANNIITLTSAAGTDAQTKCINTAITNITYATTGATGATFSGLPTGISGAWAANVVTISGTPTVAGTATYTVTLTGGCGSITATGTITVNATNTAILSSAPGTDAQTTCINTAVTNITYAIGGSATGASVSGLPAGVSGSYSAGVYTLSGTATASGTFNYTVTTTGGSCSAATATGSIIVSPAPVGGTIADVSICFADNGSLTLTGNVGAVTRWETSNDLSSWTNISNTTTTQLFTGLTTTTWYRALVQSGACASPVYSNTAKVGIHNLWTGHTSADWNTGSNWSDGLTPTTSCPDVTIPLLTLPDVYPQLTYGVATVNNIIIYPNATMLVSGASLQVAGTITNNGVLDITHGTLEMNGTSSAQTIAGSVFDTHTIQNLVVSNPNGLSLANTNDTLRITGIISFGANNAVLNTNGNLTLVSNASGTASVGDLTNGGVLSGTDINGNVTVERYIPVHPKAWQFLAVPTSGQSINAAWQEGNSTLGNRNPGYGSIITGEMAGALAAGFDIYTPAGPSMKTYNPATALWVGVANTTMQIDNRKGYMFFIRGDRTVTAFNQAATSTTLRTTGKLYTLGINAPATTSVLAGKFESIGNPYASAIDFTTINKPLAPDVDDVFYAWDPLLTNNYLGLGGYQTISAANAWKPIPGGTANYDANTPYPYIQSGQAFFVHATGAGGTVSFSESNKVNQYSMANRVTTTSSTMANRQFLRTYLYNASSMLSDGNVVAFDSNFSNVYDANDAIKIANSSENFSIVKGDKYLALEARSPVVSEDTVFYSFGNVRRTAYQFRFNPEHMAAGLNAKLVDNFLHTVTPVSMTDTSSFNFSVTTDAGSYAGNRFYLIFEQAPPVAITTISATRNNNIVTVNWRVEHEAGIVQYELQKSTDGNNFSTIMLAEPFGNNTGTFNYSALDQSPARGTNYYRVKGIKTDGTEIYSAVVRLVLGKDPVITGKNENAANRTAGMQTPAIEKTGISIYPNPVVDKILNVQFFNQAKGSYKLELVNKLGQTVYSNTVIVDNISQSESIHLNTNTAAGIYQLKIKSPVNEMSVQQVIIQ